jgi:hypothetical protein
MPKRINFFVATLLVALLAAASSFGYAQANDSGTETKNKSQPTAPNTPAPLSPLSPSPSGPTPGAPDQAPAPVFPRGPTAEQDSVLRRQRPEFKATGFELGTTASKIGLIEPSKEAAKRSGLSSFVVFPKVGFEAAYDSNLFSDKE